MKILVIGNGFLATPIIRRLESEGNELLVFSRKQNLGIRSQQVLGDIFDYENFLKVLEWKPKIVIHTAWITTPNLYMSDTSNFEYADFTSKLAQSLLNSKLEHLVILGTCAEYSQKMESNLEGVDNLSPSTLYVEQKIQALNSVKSILQGSEIRFTWARIFFPYGPDQHPLRLIPSLINSLKSGEPLILADTSSVYDWISTRDVASAISWIISHELKSEVDVGTSVGYTNLEILFALEKILGIVHKEVLGKPHGFGLNQTLIASKGSSLLSSGWIPNDSLGSGLKWVLSS